MAKVLLIDDNLDMQKMLSVVLKKQGHEVAAADRGQQGIEMATSQPYHVIILDVMMPDMNGYEVARHLRGDPRTKDLPIIILTARAQAVDQQTAMEAGADAYLSKPVDIAELNNRIQDLSAHGRPRPATVPAASAPAPLPDAGPPPPPPPPPPPATRIISIIGWRGGVGATTLAVNLAGFLAREGRRVVLIDLSPTAGHVALMLRLRPKPNWVDLPLDLNSQNLSHAFLKHDSGLHVLAAPPQPQPDGLNPNIFKSAVQLMNGVFTDIIIDCAPVLDPATRAAIAAAGRVLLPLAPEVTAVQTMTGTLAAMAALQVPPEATRLVLNYPSPSGTLLPARIENALKHPIDATLPYDPAVASALLGGTPLFAAQPRPPYIAALASLAAKL